MPFRTRRSFLADLGRGSLAVAVFGVACAPQELTVGKAGAWRRVDLGFVSAYLVVHNEVVAIVDTGVAGSLADIDEVLSGLALGWEAVEHVIVTHAHPDHVGGLREVVTRAPTAEVHMGAPDIDAVEEGPDVQAVGDGDTIMGVLEVVETPGHTPGHISILDRSLDVLIAGDALRGVDGGVAGADPAFSDDMEAANRSVARLGELPFETILFGHGEPVTEDGSEQVTLLLDSL